MTTRSFVFAVWCASGKTATQTVAALETIASNQHTLTKDGGRLMISASTGGKSFSYTLPPDATPSTVSEMALTAWTTIRDMTNDELEAWLAKPQVRTSYASFYAN
jgi:hypothetical protein